MGRTVVAVVVVVGLLPAFAAAGLLVGAGSECVAHALGDTADGGDDPCRDTFPAMATGTLGGMAAWSVLGSAGLAVGARRRERSADREPL